MRRHAHRAEKLGKVTYRHFDEEVNGATVNSHHHHHHHHQEKGQKSLNTEMIISVPYRQTDTPRLFIFRSDYHHFRGLLLKRLLWWGNGDGDDQMGDDHLMVSRTLQPDICHTFATFLTFATVLIFITWYFLIFVTFLVIVTCMHQMQCMCKQMQSGVKIELMCFLVLKSWLHGFLCKNHEGKWRWKN